MTTKPRIYVACLASYNAGILHGVWVDAVDAEEIQAGIDAVIKSSPTEGAEEWAFHDYDGFPEFAVREYQDIETLAEIGALIVEHGAIARGLMSHHSGDMTCVLEALENGPSGPFDAKDEHTALGEYACQMAEDCGDLPKQTTRYGETSRDDHWLVKYIDWEAVGRDMDFNGDAYALRTSEGWYVFHN